MSTHQIKRDLSSTLLGQAFAQLLATVAYLVLVRLYLPEAFGGFALYVSLTTIIATFACFRLELLLPLAKTAVECSTLITMCVVLMLTVFGGVLLVTIGFRTELAHLFALKKSASWLLVWLAPGTMAAAGSAIMAQMALRAGRAPILPLTRCGQVLAALAIQLALARRQDDSVGLVIGDLVSKVLEIVVLSGLLRADFASLHVIPSPKSWAAALRRHRRFLSTSAPAGILNTVAVYIPQVLSNLVYGAQSAGYFSVAQRALNLPTSALTQGSSRVFTSHLTRAIRTKPSDVITVFKSSLKRVALIGLPIFLVASVLAPSLIPRLLGAKWEPSVPLFLAMTPLAVGQLMAGAVSTTLYCVGFYGWELAWNGIRLALVSLAFWLPVRFNLQLLGSTVLFSLVTAVMYGILVYISWIAINRATEAGLENTGSAD